MNEFQYAVEDYIHFIQVERQLSVNTLASYRRDLESYVHFYRKQKVCLILVWWNGQLYYAI